MKTWRCGECGKEVEAFQEPEECPCGSEDIEEVEDQGLPAEIKSLLPF